MVLGFRPKQQCQTHQKKTLTEKEDKSEKRIEDWQKSFVSVLATEKVELSYLLEAEEEGRSRPSAGHCCEEESAACVRPWPGPGTR